MADTHRPFHKWQVKEQAFEPKHSRIEPDRKTFKEALDLGSACEELARDRMKAQRLFCEIDSYFDRLTTDSMGSKRQEGKRIWLDGTLYIVPDLTVGLSPEESYYVDVKGKQYHWYFHKEGSIQQAVDISVVDDYLTLGRYKKRPVLLLLHLIPSVSMEGYGKEPTARIHQGERGDLPLLTQVELEDLIRLYPVDDWYYLINAATVQKIGRKGQLPDMHGIKKPVYNFNLSRAVRGPAQGVLPPIEEWRRVACIEERTEDNTRKR